jgi:hypothetical protein
MEVERRCYRGMSVSPGRAQPFHRKQRKSANWYDTFRPPISHDQVENEVLNERLNYERLLQIRLYLLRSAHGMQACALRSSDPVSGLPPSNCHPSLTRATGRRSGSRSLGWLGHLDPAAHRQAAPPAPALRRSVNVSNAASQGRDVSPKRPALGGCGRLREASPPTTRESAQPGYAQFGIELRSGLRV